MIQSINPATGQPIQQYPSHTRSDVDAILSASAEAQQPWSRTSFSQRSEWMRRVASLLRARAPELARLMALEMGKPVSAGTGEAEKCAWACEYFASHAEAFLAPQIVETDARKSYVTYQPLGVLLAIMPWNFPLWQVFRFAAPALMAGNSVVLKHASNVPGCALAIEALFRDADFPADVFRLVLIRSGEVGRVIRHPIVKSISITGSTPAGRSVASIAGDALKPTVLELGGSDPFIVLHDADVDAAVETAVASRMINNGQSCISAKRFIAVGAVFDEFEQKMVERMRAIEMGDPLDPATRLGPLARLDLRDDLHNQVDSSIALGAEPLVGCEIPKREGAYYPASVLTNVRKGMPAFDEELFGPVAALIRASDEADAIAVANDTPFGLGAAIFTRDIARGERIAVEELQAGSCFVNELVKSDPRLPFGGTKDSGYGRELSQHGIHELVNIKTVYIK
ncbi:MAG: succinate-semialdehyde dehydrogenase [Candidatus Hydrogenedentota bacterium]